MRQVVIIIRIRVQTTRDTVMVVQGIKESIYALLMGQAMASTEDKIQSIDSSEYLKDRGK